MAKGYHWVQIFRMRLPVCSLILSLTMLVSTEAQAQLQRPANPDYPRGYSSKFVRRSAAHATLGSGFLIPDTDRAGHFGLGEIAYAYAITRQLDLGAGIMGSLLCNKAYYDGNGAIVSDPDNPDGTRCDRSWHPATAQLFARYYPLRGIPAFAQAGAGWSFDGEAPAYSLAGGYFLHLGARFGIVGMLRYAGLVPLPDAPDLVRPAGGLRLEIGAAWNL